MPVTININNLTLCHKGSNGISTATLPDVCKTPSPGGPVPIPYPNIAMSMDLMKGTTTVKADGGMMCANYGSEFFKSTGDEPGVAGGVVSSTFIKEATWIMFSFDVKLQGKAACRLTDKMFHNHQNTVNMCGLRQMSLKTGKWDWDCVLKILCKKSPDTVKKAAKSKIFAVDSPMIFDDPIFKGGKWTTVEFEAAGTQGAGEINMARDMSCEEAAVTLYHETLHSDQPKSMSWPEKEYDAYARTEEWTIKNGLPSQGTNFRKDVPLPPGQYGPPTQVVDTAAIKAKVDKDYPFIPPATPGGPTPPQITGKSPDGKTVFFDDGTSRPPREGDRFDADKPRNPKNEKQIPPKDVKCP